MTTETVEVIDPVDLREKMQVFLGLMALANGSFGEFLDWVADYVTVALVDPNLILSELDGDIEAAREIVQDKSAQVMAQIPTAGGVH